MSMTELRRAFDQGDVAAARTLLVADRSLTTTLIEAPDIEPTSPLTYVGMARFYGYADHNRTGDLARVLIDAGADKDDETKNGSPLICAASHGDADVVRALLDAGADVELTDSPPDTALRLAAAFGHPEVVDVLVAAGARVGSVIEAAGAGDLSGWSIADLSAFDRACALRAAAVNERLDVVDQLLAAGPDRCRGRRRAGHSLGGRARTAACRRAPPGERGRHRSQPLTPANCHPTPADGCRLAGLPITRRTSHEHHRVGSDNDPGTRGRVRGR